VTPDQLTPPVFPGNLIEQEVSQERWIDIPEGIIVAPETSHAVATTIRKAVEAKEEGKEKVILFNLSGHGLMDLTGYEAFMSGGMRDYPLPDEEMAESLRVLEGLPTPDGQVGGSSS